MKRTKIEELQLEHGQLNSEVAELVHALHRAQSEGEQAVRKKEEKIKTLGEAMKVLQARIEVEDTQLKIEQLLAAAEQLDAHFNVNTLSKCEKLANALGSPPARAIRLSYTARCLTISRMKRDAETAHFGKPPFPTWVAMFSSWLVKAKPEAKQEAA